MPFKLRVPLATGAHLALDIDAGESLFVLGANGSGKSSLMHLFYQAHHRMAHRISAHRQTWFSSSAVNLSSEQKRSFEMTIQGTDVSQEARWRDDYPTQRTSIALYDLVDAENIRARTIAGAVGRDDLALARSLARKQAPIALINDLLQQSNLPITISIHESEQIVATKSGGAPYNIAELSDGERNALLIAASVLTIDPGMLVLIDEPERHLHRSIISPLLTLLFAHRHDCAFVVSTHDVLLPIDTPSARVALVRGCTYSNASIVAWDVDLLPPQTAIDEDLKKDILGSRRTVLFVEGTDSSLDKPLYSLIFPNVSIVSKSSCRDVEHAVSGIRDSSVLHWVRAFGIIDDDRRVPSDLDRLKAKGVYSVPAFSVESLYYHPEIQRRVAERHATITEDDPSKRLENAKGAAIAALRPHIQRLSERTAEKAIREMFLEHLPSRQDVVAGNPVAVSIDVSSAVAEERQRLQKAVDACDLATILAMYPVRETPALIELATKLGFQTRNQYEAAVRKLLMDDVDALSFLRSLFGALNSDLNTV